MNVAFGALTNGTITFLIADFIQVPFFAFGNWHWHFTAAGLPFGNIHESDVRRCVFRLKSRERQLIRAEQRPRS